MPRGGSRASLPSEREGDPGIGREPPVASAAAYFFTSASRISFR
jgi:hypothetical protein